MTISFRTLDDAPLAHARALVRIDLNLPVEKNGRIADATRIDRVLPTLREMSDKGAKVIILAHFGRPNGKPVAADSLRPIAPALSVHLGRQVRFAQDCVGEPARAAIAAMADGDILLLENTRFHPGEEENDPAFAREIAALGDLYVNDAFSCAHRAHVSTEAIAHLLPAYAGRAMQAELEALTIALDQPRRPVAAIVGGSKVSTKLDLLHNLVKRVDMLIIGGGMANTFLAAQGADVGASLCEHDLAPVALAILTEARAAGCEIILPVDVVVAPEFKAHAPSRVVEIGAIGAADMALDIGPATIALVQRALTRVRTLVWNGPFGAFELPPFDAGTNAIAHTAALMTKNGELVTVAGGGDTVSALNHAGSAQDFTYLSTAGGAFLEWLEGKTLPAVEALHASAAVVA